MLEKLSSEDMPQQRTDEIDPNVLYGNLTGSGAYHRLKRLAVDGYTMKELAQEEGISMEACKKRVQRSRQEVRKYFEKK